MYISFYSLYKIYEIEWNATTENAIDINDQLKNMEKKADKDLFQFYSIPESISIKCMQNSCEVLSFFVVPPAGDCRRWRMIKYKTDARSAVLTVARFQQRRVAWRKSDKEVPSASLIWPRSTNKHASSCADAASFRVFFSPSSLLKQRKKKKKKREENI